MIVSNSAANIHHRPLPILVLVGPFARNHDNTYYLCGMNKDCPEIITIKAEIEASLERRIKTPPDFDFLSGAIWERVHEYISPTTLKRTWGYVGGSQTIRNSTLNILARFAGHREWDDFLTILNETSTENSAFATSHTIDARKLAVGACVEVAWQPNRHCVFRHLGGCRFEVEKSENSKLKPGDTFEAVFFIQDEPLYLDNLHQGAKKPTSYLCGNKKGLTMVK